jgi:hypothetical protein
MPPAKEARTVTPVAIQEPTSPLVKQFRASGPRRKREGKMEYQKDGARYFMRSKAKSVEGWTADYYRTGSKHPDIKIRLGETDAERGFGRAGPRRVS